MDIKTFRYPPAVTDSCIPYGIWICDWATCDVCQTNETEGVRGEKNVSYLSQKHVKIRASGYQYSILFPAFLCCIIKEKKC